jgi:hypothetical protein
VAVLLANLAILAYLIVKLRRGGHTQEGETGPPL